MENYQVRVVEERKDLDEKISKLSLYVECLADNGDPLEKAYLKKQLKTMIDYSAILSLRISKF